MNHAPRILALFLLALTTAIAGEPPPVTPVNQPLLVLRATDPATPKRLRATRQAKAFGLQEKDFSGSIPGVGAGLDSLKSFLDALAAADARNLWYCFSQKGSSIASQTGALGWDMPENTPDTPLPRIARQLEQMGLKTRGIELERRPLAPGLARITILPNSDARTELMGGASAPDHGWRDNLGVFLARRDDSLGVWVNARPILGVLSLLTGIDFRGTLRTRNLATPAWANIELFDSQGNLGFEARIANILPQELTNSDRAPALIRRRDDPLLELNLPAAAGLCRLFTRDNDALLLANIDISSILPQSASVSIRRDSGGRPVWNVICLMPDKARFNEQIKRLRAWLEALSAVSSPVFGIEETKSPHGDALWSIRAGELSFTMGTADIEAAGRDHALLILAPTPADWPDPAALDIVPGDASCLAEWRATLDPASRAAAIDTLIRLTRQRDADDFIPRFRDDMLPGADSGRIALDGDSLVVRSENGLLPLLIPEILRIMGT